MNKNVTIIPHSEVYRAVSVLLALALIGTSVGAGFQAGYGQSAEQTVSQVSAEVTGSSNALWLADKYGYLTDEDIQYIIGLYQVRNCALISLILTPAAGAACSAGTLT